MPDITMCKNDNCPISNKCYRHEAIPNEYNNQSWNNFQFSEDDGCEYFKAIKGRLTAHDFYLK